MNQLHHNQQLFIDWFNNFGTLARFAEYYSLTVKRAARTIAKGRAIHQDRFGHH